MINPMAFQQALANPQMMQSLQQQFQQFTQQLRGGYSMPMNPQQLVQQKLANGEMTQSQFEQLRGMANAMMGVQY